MPYRGRFAPSPTGPLHLGSLIAALASYLDARYHRGIWLVRMEDLDPPREAPGAADSILHSLQRHGLQWDDVVLYQSTRANAYREALQTLRNKGDLFDCNCTRAALAADGACQGQCKQRQGAAPTPSAIRIAVPAGTNVRFSDSLQGEQFTALDHAAADFVVRRKDGLNAYQLAVVVDDAFQGISHVVRGSDLLDSTPRQIFLQKALSYSTPIYTHLPVITDDAGQKFSKQNHAPALLDANAANNLRRALMFLRQLKPPGTLTTTEQLLTHAIKNWAAERIPAVLSIAGDA